MSIFESKEAMPAEPTSLNNAEVVRVQMTRDDARAVNAAFFPDYTAPSVHNLPCRYGRGKHY